MSDVILVATHHGDPVAELVVSSLTRKGQKPYVVHTDALCQRTTSFSFTHKNDSAILEYEEWKLDLATVGSAWYWRAVVKDARNNSDVEREMQKTLMGIWETVDETVWLNHPHIIKRTQNKLMQLRHAQKAGLRTIPTHTTNSIEILKEQAPEQLLIKMPGKGIVHKDLNLHVMYSTHLHKNSLAVVKANPFPGMYQPFLSKKKEWRITIVGDKVFSAAIYTDTNTKVDWRPDSHNEEAVRFVVEEFPAEAAQKCKKLLQILDLRYGAFDFIETEDDELYFVEVNSNGQFLWLEKELGLPISDAIADELITIANS